MVGLILIIYFLIIITIFIKLYVVSKCIHKASDFLLIRNVKMIEEIYLKEPVDREKIERLHNSYSTDLYGFYKCVFDFRIWKPIHCVKPEYRDEVLKYNK